MDAILCGSIGERERDIVIHYEHYDHYDHYEHYEHYEQANAWLFVKFISIKLK